MMLERQRFAKYSCKDIFRILLACETLVNNQLDLSHSCLLYRESNSRGGEKPLQMFTKCLHTASNLLCTSKHWGCCKIKSYLQQHLSFFRRAIRGVPGITFSVQAKSAHAESVIFVYGKQTCSSFVVLGRLFQAVFGSNSAFPNRPSASRLQSFRILNAVARIKRRVSLLVFPRVRNLPNP